MTQIIQSPKSSSEHLPELDGLRGIAALGVTFFHAYADHPEIAHAVQWMWSFVDLFFVLSGFLITRILITTDRISLRNFWARRILRIWPVYYSTLAVALLLQFIKPDGQFPDPPIAGVPESLVFLQFTDLYFSGEPYPYGYLVFFRHSWSLAIEEQFYLIWPLILFAVNCRHRAILILGALLVCSGLWLRNEGFFNGLLLTRIDGLIAGVILAFWYTNQPPAFWRRFQKSASPQSRFYLNCCSNASAVDFGAIHCRRFC